MANLDFGRGNNEVTFTFQNPLEAACSCNRRKAGKKCRLEALHKVPMRVSVKDMMRQQGIDPEKRRADAIKQAKELAEIEAKMTPEQLDEVRRLQREQHERKRQEVEKARKEMEKERKKAQQEATKEATKEANRKLADEHQFMSGLDEAGRERVRALQKKQLEEDAAEQRRKEPRVVMQGQDGSVPVSELARQQHASKAKPDKKKKSKGKKSKKHGSKNKNKDEV